MKFFMYNENDGQLYINDGTVLLMREFEVLCAYDRNKTKEDKTGKKRTKAFRELTFIYLFYDWESPYFSMLEQDRYNEALRDSKLTEEDLENPEFKNACRKYDDVQNSSIEMRMLKGARKTAEEVIYYLEHLSLQERDPITNKPILKTKDVIAEIKGCKDMLQGLADLERQVKTGEDTEAVLRGDTEVGMFD